MSATKPYYSDELVTLYLGDCREVLPALGVTANCIIADPPYESTGLEWDRWPDGWVEVAARVSNSMWCFLPRRQFVEPPFRGQEFHAAGWKFSQPGVWEKHNGSSRAADRLRLVHEEFGHWYRGRWSDIYHQAPRVKVLYRTADAAGSAQPKHTGTYASGTSWTDDGTRIVPSVIRVRSMQHGAAIHETEKPEGILAPLIEYACPSGGLVVDPFAGSASTLIAARNLGRRAIGIESREACAKRAAMRLSQSAFDFGEAS